MMDEYVKLAKTCLIDGADLPKYQSLLDKIEFKNKEINKLKINNAQQKLTISNLKGKIRNSVEVPKLLRKRVLDRDGHVCLKCGSSKKLTIDHVVPRSNGGSNSMENLQTLCSKCNFEKQDTYADYRKK